jgi:hypothetical protein
MRVRLWIPGFTCLACGLVFRVAMGWNGFYGGKIQYVQIAFGQIIWYVVGLLLIAAHLARTAVGSRAWALWVVGVLVAIMAVLSSCPP